MNNAGFTRPGMLHKMTEDEWDAVVDAHLKGPFLCIQAASKYFKEQNYGKVINVSSVAGLVGTVGQVNYSAAKGGILSFTKSVARELARYNVCANVISLGIVETDMTEKIRTDEKLKEIYMNRILLKRFATADDISPAFVFLASTESDYITGQVLVCGRRLWHDLVGRCQSAVSVTVRSVTAQDCSRAHARILEPNGIPNENTYAVALTRSLVREACGVIRCTGLLDVSKVLSDRQKKP